MTSIHARDSHQTFDVMKFKKIRDQLLQGRLVRRKHILAAELLSEEDMLLVHQKEYIYSLRSPVTVGQALALDYVNPWDNYIMEYFRYVCGGTLLAVEYALDYNTTVFNLGGGYHHAHPDRAEGFCLINDVAVAIEKMRKMKKVQNVLVVDLDYHQGNGTTLFYRDDPGVFTFSMHSLNWATVESATNIDIELPSHVEDEQYLTILKENLPGVFEVFHPDLVIYLAGSDPFVLDSLGDFNISEEGMLKRDMFVHQQVREREIPLAVVAAGGYGPESWKVYYNFIKTANKERRCKIKGNKRNQKLTSQLELVR
jgi:acetoin utilization deacetylase AcuC-like enzyme